MQYWTGGTVMIKLACKVGDGSHCCIGMDVWWRLRWMILVHCKYFDWFLLGITFCPVLHHPWILWCCNINMCKAINKMNKSFILSQRKKRRTFYIEKASCPLNWEYQIYKRMNANRVHISSSEICFCKSLLKSLCSFCIFIFNISLFRCS